MCYIHIVIANIDRCCHGTYYLLKRNEGLLSKENVAEMYPGFQIMGSSGPLFEKFGGPLLSFGGPADL